MMRAVKTRTALAALVVPTLLLSGCGGGDAKKGSKATPSPSASTPSTSVDVPAGVQLTEPGAELKFGEPATVAYEANAKRKSVLELTVTSVAKVSMKEFDSYVLDAASKASTPYFVRVKVTNAGTGDLGRTDVPLWAVDQTNTLVHSSTFSNDFKKCPSQPLPAAFGHGKSVTTCLVYLVPNHGSVDQISYRPDQSVSPIVWNGTIADRSKPAAKKKKAS